MKKIKEIFLYLVFGTLTAIVNILSYFLFEKIGLNTVISTIAAWAVAVLFAFVTNKLFVFKSEEQKVGIELLSFFVCRGLTGLFDLAVMVLFVDFFNFSSMLIKLISNIIVGILNYIFSKFLIFNKKDKNNDKIYENAVICFGDSITEGMAMSSENTYPAILKEHLKTQYPVINAGVGGENSYTICSRANALPFTVKNNIVFRKGQTEYVSNYKIFCGINGETICYRNAAMGNELPINSVIVGGKHYGLRLERVGIEEEDKYILFRENSDREEIIKSGEKIEFDYRNIYKNCYCAIVLQGANDGDMPIDTIIERYRKIANLHEKFIVLIPHYRGDDTAKLFYDAFGENCVDLREFCKEEVWTKYGIEKDENDIRCLNDGKLSTRFIYNAVYGDCHLNEIGYKILADLVYKKGIQLNYWQ